MFRICWKCSRHIEPLTRREKDPKTKKIWQIEYCPYERCNANLEIYDAPQIRLWNGSFFEDETNPS